MTNLHKVLLVTLSISTLFFSTATAQLEFKGEFQPRAQFNNGFRKLPDATTESALVFLQRSRLKLGYTYKEKVKLFFSLQDSRVWGDQDDRADRARTGMFEAWGEVYLNKKMSIKVGRQALKYDDGYLLTDPGWVVNGRSYDAALFKYQDSTFSAHVGVSQNQDRIVLNRTRFQNELFKNLHFLWLEKKWGESYATFTFINRGLQRADSTIKYTQTFGPNIKLIKDNKFIQGIYYFQTGTDTLDRDVRASMWSLKVGYNPNDRFELIAGADVLSGTDGADRADPNFRETNIFDNLYGYRHKYFGYMDYFYRGFFPPSGLRDYMFKAKYKAGRLDTDLHLHSFHGQADVFDPEDPTREMDSRLGFEVDLVFTYHPNDITSVKIGYAQMFGTETLEVVQGLGDSDRIANFAFIQMLIKPDFLK
ncbi:MAG: alginate export family protein [Bacteroidota bacterium]